MFCEKCGRLLDEDDIVCPLCHTKINVAKKTECDVSDMNRAKDNEKMYEPEAFGKSRFVAGFLQIFLGALGIGRFYMGCKSTGIMQIIASICTFGVGGFVWGFIDGVRILKGYPRNDGYGNELVD